MLENSLKEMLLYANEHVPYYKDLFAENRIDPCHIQTMDDFSKIPLLTKSIVIKNPKIFVADEYRNYPKINNLSVRRTSGSTGKYLKIFWDNTDNIKSLTGLWLLRKKYFGILPSDKFCYFFTTEYLHNKFVNVNEDRYSPTQRSVGFTKVNLNTERLIEICKIINDYRPKWLLLQPSIARLITDCIIENNLPVPNSIEYIEFTGELLFADLRKKIEDVWGCKTGNQYGCNETNSIAYECADEKMHCMSSNAFIEIIKDGLPADDGVEGDIYITTLINKAMPFIRYKTGDQGYINRNIKCACGSSNPTLKLTNGRDNDYIITKDNEKINAYTFLYPIECINEKIGNIIKQFQIIETNYDEFTVKMSVNNSYMGWSHEISNLFKENIQEVTLKDSTFNFEFSNVLFPDEISGKLAFFKNQINK